MGQKVNPEAFRLGHIQGFSWKSRWFADKKNYKKMVLQDVVLRKALLERLKMAGVMRVEIDRSPRELRIKVIVSRPGMVIGRSGSGTEELKKFILELVQTAKGEKPPKVDLIVEEVKEPEISAYLIAN